MRSLALSCFLLAVVGCSNAPADAPDYELSSKGKTPSDTQAQGDDSPAPADSTLQPTEPAPADTTTPAAPTSVTFGGTLAATTAAAFGGSPYCKYDVTLKNVSIEVTKADGGDVTAVVVKDTVNETTSSCPYAAMSPAAQEFTLKSASATSDGFHLELTGADTNKPATALAIDLVEKDGGYTAAAKWHRTDEGAPLDWTVTANVTLAQK